MFPRDIFSSRLKGLIKQRGISQQILADAINISRPAITQLCSGTNQPSVETLVDIAHYFDVSIDYLVGDTNNPKRN